MDLFCWVTFGEAVGGIPDSACTADGGSSTGGLDLFVPAGLGFRFESFGLGARRDNPEDRH